MFSGSNNLILPHPPFCSIQVQRWVVLVCILFLPIILPIAEVKCESPEETKQKYTLVFKNNQGLSEGKLRKAAAYELEQYDTQGLRPSDIDDAAFQMTVAYQRAGYHFANVEYTIDRESHLTTVTFDITEGPKVLIDQIVFVGNHSFPDEELRHFFEDQDEGLIRSSELVFVRSAVGKALSQIRQYYISKGYLDVSISKPVIDFVENRSRATIRIFITEGVQYIIREIHIAGEQLETIAQPIAEIRESFVGKSYFRRRRVLLRSSLEDALGNKGFPRAQVSVKEDLNPRTGEVILSATVESGPQVNIGKIVVQGNLKTKASFILDRLLFEPGDQYSTDKRRRSIRALFRTGLFSRVDIRLDPRKDGAPEDLIVEVVENKFLEVYFEPGWGSYERLRFKTGFRHRNMFGAGIIINPEVAVSMKSYTTTLRFTDPWLFNTDITMDVPLYFNWREEPAYTRQDLGGGAFFSKQITTRWKVTAGYSLRTTKLSEINYEEYVEETDTNYDLGAVSAQGTFDSRNDLFFPTDGRRFFVSAEHADDGLGGSITFSRLSGGYRHFFQLAKSTVLGIRLSSGLILPDNRQEPVPIGERFFNGGASTVRSFKQSELGPKDQSGNALGGHGFNVCNIEVRQRLIGNLIGTVFFDAGNIAPNRPRLEDFHTSENILSETMEDFFNDFRYGVGMGLQYLLPLGPLRLDVGYNPSRDKDEGEEDLAFHFSIGAAF